MENKFLYYVDRIIRVYQLFISLAVGTNIITIAHGVGHLGFACSCKIVLYSWFIERLTRLF